MASRPAARWLGAVAPARGVAAKFDKHTKKLRFSVPIPANHYRPAGLGFSDSEFAAPACEDGRRIWETTDMMRSRRSAGRIGFVRKADTPAARACSTSFALAWAVRKITGVCDGGALGGTTPAGRVPARRWRRNSSPLTG